MKLSPFPPWVERWLWAPVMEGHVSLKELHEFWTIEELYIWHLNKKYENIAYEREFEKAKRKSKTRG